MIVPENRLLWSSNVSSIVIQQMIQRINDLNERIVALERREYLRVPDTIIRVDAPGTGWTGDGAIRLGDQRRTYGNAKYGQALYRAEDATTFNWS